MQILAPSPLFRNSTPQPLRSWVTPDSETHSTQARGHVPPTDDVCLFIQEDSPSSSAVPLLGAGEIHASGLLSKQQTVERETGRKKCLVTHQVLHRNKGAKPFPPKPREERKEGGRKRGNASLVREVTPGQSVKSKGRILRRLKGKIFTEGESRRC